MENNYPALVRVGQEPEHKKSPPLKISSVGTEIKKGIYVVNYTIELKLL